MPLVLPCPDCGRALSVREVNIGRMVQCPACRRQFVAQPPPLEAGPLEAESVPPSPPERIPRLSLDDDVPALHEAPTEPPAPVPMDEEFVLLPPGEAPKPPPSAAGRAPSVSIEKEDFVLLPPEAHEEETPLVLVPERELNEPPAAATPTFPGPGMAEDDEPLVLQPADEEEQAETPPSAPGPFDAAGPLPHLDLELPPACAPGGPAPQAIPAPQGNSENAPQAILLGPSCDAPPAAPPPVAQERTPAESPRPVKSRRRRSTTSSADEPDYSEGRAARRYRRPVPAASPFRKDNQPQHRALLILGLGIAAGVLGLLSLFASFVPVLMVFVCLAGVGTGTSAWVLGAQDLKRMEGGHMDPAGEPLTRAGRIAGAAGVVLTTLVFLLALTGAIGNFGRRKRH